MDKLLTQIEDVILMGPGPSCVHEEVYEALSCKTLGHLDPYFIHIMDEIKINLQKLMKTKNALTIPISGTGSAGMETCLVNLIEPGDQVLILVNGVFGQRMVEVAQRHGALVDAVEFEWGKAVETQEVKKYLQKKSYKLVAVVHAETSTGVKNPVDEIGDLVKATEALYVVDAVTSLGGMEIDVDKWHIDALYSGSQKCLSCPPGLAPVTLSTRALNRIAQRKTKVTDWYFDLSLLGNYWNTGKRVYHHTAPVNMLYALYQALRLINHEGDKAVFERHQKVHQLLVAGCDKLGLEMLVEPNCRLPMLNMVKLPKHINDETTRSILRKQYKIEIGGGLGVLAGKVWRIGLMGHTAREENVNRLLAALKKILG